MKNFEYHHITECARDFCYQLAEDPLALMTGFSVEEETVDIYWEASWSRGGYDSGCVSVPLAEFDKYCQQQYDLKQFDEALKTNGQSPPS